MSRTKKTSEKSSKRAVNLYLSPEAISLGERLAKHEDRSLSQHVNALIRREAERLNIKPKAA